MGGDFAYYYAEHNFKMLENISEYLSYKTNGKITFKFSTVDEYFKEMKSDLKERGIKLK